MLTTDERLNGLETRNLRVESDKSWETSLTRRGLIMVMTYVSVLLYGVAIGADRPAITAVIPTAGFFLSTLTLPVVKRKWLNRRTT